MEEMIALYARCSKSDGSQDPENQLMPLRQLAKALGGKVVGEYIDLASGGSSDRVNFLRMMQDAEKQKFNLVIVWSLDRLSREGIANTTAYIQKLKRNGISIKSLKEGWLDTRDSGVSELLLAIFAWLAEQEKRRIRERTLEGLARAKREGKRLGRPQGSKDKKERRKSGYWLRYAKNK